MCSESGFSPQHSCSYSADSFPNRETDIFFLSRKYNKKYGEKRKTSRITLSTFAPEFSAGRSLALSFFLSVSQFIESRKIKSQESELSVQWTWYNTPQGSFEGRKLFSFLSISIILSSRWYFCTFSFVCKRIIFYRKKTFFRILTDPCSLFKVKQARWQMSLCQLRRRKI